MTNEDPRAARHAAPPMAPVGELHPVSDEAGADSHEGDWKPRNLPIAAITVLIMIAAILAILVVAFQLVPS